MKMQSRAYSPRLAALYQTVQGAAGLASEFTTKIIPYIWKDSAQLAAGSFKKISVLIFTLLFALPAAAGVDLQKEKEVGEKADKMIRKHFGVYEDEKLQKYVSGIGKKLLESIEDPEVEFQFLVIDDPMLNAFAVPGGYIYITRGMLAYLDSEAALAGILGHEIGHVIGHHSYKQMKKNMKDTLLIIAGLGAGIATGQGANTIAAWATATTQLSAMSQAGYGRDNEMQSDEFGMIYAYDAGYDPREHSKFFRVLQFKQRVSGVGYHGFMASHPDTIERIIRTREKADILVNRGKEVVVKRGEYLEEVKGLTYGKGDRKLKKKPPFVIELYTVKEGDDFRSVAREAAGDESMAFEIAMMNSMTEKDKPEPGYLLKVPVKRKPQPEGELSSAKNKE